MFQYYRDKLLSYLYSVFSVKLEIRIIILQKAIPFNVTSKQLLDGIKKRSQDMQDRI